MKQHLKSLIALVGALCAFGLVSAQAEDNTSTIISAVSSNNAGANYFVGEPAQTIICKLTAAASCSTATMPTLAATAPPPPTRHWSPAPAPSWEPTLSSNRQRGKSNSLTVANGATVPRPRLFGPNAGSDGNWGLVTGPGSVLQTGGVNMWAGPARITA